MADMRDYIHNPKVDQGVKLGDSIVRRYSIHDETHFSIEQEVCISLNHIKGQWISMYILYFDIKC